MCKLVVWAACLETTSRDNQLWDTYSRKAYLG